MAWILASLVCMPYSVERRWSNTKSVMIPKTVTGQLEVVCYSAGSTWPWVCCWVPVMMWPIVVRGMLGWLMNGVQSNASSTYRTH
jgi:hypothetical protein